MAFLVLGDIFAIRVFPVMLGGFGVLILYGYTVLLYHLGLKQNIVIEPCATAVIYLGIHAVSYVVGRNTPHLRDSVRALQRYVSEFLRIVIAVELPMMAVNLGLMTACSALHIGLGVFAEYFCLAFGDMAFGLLARRTFLWAPLPDMQPEHVRGEVIGTPDDIEWRAWRDANGK